MKSIKEKQMLVKWAKAMNESIDPDILREVEKHEKMLDSVKRSVRTNLAEDLKIAANNSSAIIKEETNTVSIKYDLPPTLEEVMAVFEETVEQVTEEVIKENLVINLAKEETIIDQVVSKISEEEVRNKDSFQQPNPEPVDNNLIAIQKKLKFLEQAIGKIAAHGPGSGAGDVINLDHPAKVVSDDYTFTNKDYYVGVNANKSVTLTLPTYLGRHGRMVVVKDESGNCSSNPIVVNGTVDNDPGGFILQMDNGGIQMIYREGWRII